MKLDNLVKNIKTSHLQGWTMVEMLVVIAVLAILALVEWPVFARVKPESLGIYCLNNQKQLALAAIVYAQENQDKWVYNFPGQSPCWVTGSMDFNAGNTDNTNAAKLVNPTVSVMGPYVVDPKIFHCPADESFVPGKGFRVRSVSMNEAIGTVATTTGSLTAGSAVNGQWLLDADIGTSYQSLYRTYGKTSSMSFPGPANLWVFLDEHPDSINDAAFAVQMLNTGPTANYIDIPASYHDGGCGISFADGHAGIHQWVGTVVKKPISNGGASLGNGASGTYAGGSSNDIADITWLQLHTSAHY